MDFQTDLFEQLGEDSDPSAYQDPYEEMRPECIIVDKVYDSCFQRECEPSKIINLPAGGPYTCGSIVFGEGYIVDGTLSVVPVRLNFARVKFTVRIPFTLTVNATCEPCKSIQLDDCVDFNKDIEVFFPQGPSEFSLDIVVETRSQLLNCEIIGTQAIVSIGSFVVTKVVGKVQLLVQTFGFCPQPRECTGFIEEDVCKKFETAPFPRFFAPQIQDIDTDA